MDKKKLYESIMTSVAKEVKKALNESLDDWDEDEEYEFDDEGEIVTFGDILNAMYDVNPHEIINSEGTIIEDLILNDIMYPENGARIASVAVDLAEEMIEDKLTYAELCERYEDEKETEI